VIETLLRERARPGARVLDLGCGDAGLTRRLAALGYEAIGLDADFPRLLEAARRASPGAPRISPLRPPGPVAPSAGPSPAAPDAGPDPTHPPDRATLLVCGDAARLPLRDACFDAVASHSVFEHLPDPPAAFREARRILRAGGFLLVNVPHRWGPREGHVPAWFAHWLPAGALRRAWLRLLGKDAGKWDAYLRGIRYWTPSSLKRDLGRAFERAEIISLRRYERPEELTTAGQRWVLRLLRLRPAAWLGRLLVRAMGHIDGLGVAEAPAGRRSG
jgi:SAM-dependent methyltransferase